MTATLDFLLAQGTPLAPSLHTRLIALVVVEAFLLTTAVLLYLLWVQLKKQPLDEWWAARKAEGFSPRMRALMAASEQERLAAEGKGPGEPPQAEGPAETAAEEQSEPQQAAEPDEPAAEAALEPHAGTPLAGPAPHADSPMAAPTPAPRADPPAVKPPATKRPAEKLPAEPPRRPLAGPPRPPAEPPTR